ncbi:hypothetical protein C8R43DRAFT_213648 [Mycena crocata]|nr:hypothetical protein C8R43DRAFT_213648 [Mycena crocata]
MKSPVLLVLASAMASTVTSSDLPSRKSMSPAGYSNHHARTVGAAYFMTNEPTGNYLVSAIIGSDGKLALYEAAYTGGSGAHGLSATPGPVGNDPLFSQGSVRVSTTHRFVATVNAGSNTVSAFGIDHSNPARLTRIGNPVSSGGEFPTSLAINKAGNRVCVVNGGKVNGVSCYHFDAWKGLTPLKNTIRSLGLNQTTPATGPPNTPSQIIFSKDEKQLVVSVKAGILATFDINADGSLSKDFNTITGGMAPFSLQYIPGENALISADPGVGYDIFNLASKQQPAVVSTPIPGQGATCWSAYSKESGNFYMIDAARSTATEIHVSGSLNSTTVKQYSLGTDGPLDTDIATVGKTDFIYSLAANATSLTVLSVNGPGKAKIYQRLDLAGPAKAANLALHGTNLQGMATFIGK